MTAKSRVNLQAAFQTGDEPTGDDFTDLIDSAVNTVDTTAQSIASNFTAPNIAGNTVSAGTVYVDNLFGGSIYGTTPHHNSYVEVTAIVSALTSSTPTHLSQGWTTQVQSGFTQVSGAVTYTGTVSALFNCQYGMASVIAYTSEELRSYFTKNSAPVTASNMHWTGRAAVHANVVGGAIIQLNPTDVLRQAFEVTTCAQVGVEVQRAEFIITYVGRV